MFLNPIMASIGIIFILAMVITYPAGAAVALFMLGVLLVIRNRTAQ